MDNNYGYLDQEVEQFAAYADTLREAVDAAYAKVGRIRFDNAYWRRDIGARALAVKED